MYPENKDPLFLSAYIQTHMPRYFCRQKDNKQIDMVDQERKNPKQIKTQTQKNPNQSQTNPKPPGKKKAHVSEWYHSAIVVISMAVTLMSPSTM